LSPIAKAAQRALEALLVGASDQQAADAAGGDAPSLLGDHVETRRGRMDMTVLQAWNADRAPCQRRWHGMRCSSRRVLV
jgi:hypothetical protein